MALLGWIPAFFMAKQRDTVDFPWGFTMGNPQCLIVKPRVLSVKKTVQSLVMTKATFVIQNVGPMSCRPITWLKHVETPSKSRYIKIYPPYILVSLLIKPMEHHIVGDFGRYHIFLSTSLPPFYPMDPYRTSPVMNHVLVMLQCIARKIYSWNHWFYQQI